MRPHWPKKMTFDRVQLDVEDATCRRCGGRMQICDHRHHRVFTLHGPVHLVNRLVRCPDKTCPGHRVTYSPETETLITLPWWSISWDVFCWMGHRRFARHWSVAQIRAELGDSYGIGLSDDAIEKYLRRYQEMLAARQQDPRVLEAVYRDTAEVMLAIDGLQPEKGHETLYVVRELGKKRVWFAESLLCSSQAEIRQLIVQARQWAERLGKRVRLWISDKQEAFVQGIAAEFPDVPHRYCRNHFLRNLAKPILEKDSHAKVQMRRKVRGLRAIEREVLEQRRVQQTAPPPCVPAPPPSHSAPPMGGSSTDVGDVVLDYCTAVRGILNDDQGGPLHPPGLRMAEALDEVQRSLERNLEMKKGGAPSPNSGGWPAVLSAAAVRSKMSSKKCATMSNRYVPWTRPSIRSGAVANSARHDSRPFEMDSHRVTIRSSSTWPQ